ncbi:MAG: hypothetical protein KJN90_02755, partial [Gammaproteobacteria bacterium]|nr:hypothetical protein [Gammaproteobacteria bacterium]
VLHVLYFRYSNDDRIIYLRSLDRQLIVTKSKKTKTIADKALPSTLPAALIYRVVGEFFKVKKWPEDQFFRPLRLVVFSRLALNKGRL